MDPRRLCHISDLPNSLHFLPIEIKHLLPVHHPKFIDNLLTILASQAVNLEWPIYQDQSLTLTSVSYALVSAGWCEDIDGQPNHLKSTLQLSSIILNYLHSMLSSSNQKQYKAELVTVQRADFINDQGVFYPQKQAFPVTSLIAYNIYKTKDKQGKTRFIFMVGRHNDPQLRLFSLLESVRFWNLHRLKSDSCSELTIGRSHKLIEHILVILRGFIGLQEEDNQINKRQLQMTLDKVDDQEIPQRPPQTGIEEQFNTVFARFEWNYHGKYTKKDIASFCSQCLTTVLKLTPRNTSCSYAGRIVHIEKMNQVVLLWMMSHKKQAVLMSQEVQEGAVRNCLKFAQKKSVEGIRDSGVNIADQILRSSLKVLSKYSNEKDRSQRMNSASQSKNNLLNSDSDSLISQQFQKTQMDRMSAFSKVSFKSRMPKDKSSKDLKVSHLVSDNFQSLSSPLMVHRDKEYAQMIDILTKWQLQYGKIVPWTQLKTALRKNCENAQLRYGKVKNTSQQNSILLSFLALKSFLDAEELKMLVKNYTYQRQSIFQILFQRSNSGVLLEIARKLAKDFAHPLYQAYITKQFKIDRNNILTVFLKRYLVTFQMKTTLINVEDRISVPILLDLLERKQFQSQAYREIAGNILQDVFREEQPLKIISPILHEIYLNLVDDHHEELVNSLLGDFAFEILYFSFDAQSLNNTPYCQDIDLKLKKTLQILREGGFNRLGFELRAVLKPIFFKYSNHSLPQARIYEQIIINKPIHIAPFMQLMIQSQFTQHFLELARFYRSLRRCGQNITRPISGIFLSTEVTQFRYQAADQRVQLTSGKSQSGIFQHLLNYNPQLKIAGMSLSQILQKRQSEKKVLNLGRDRFDVEYLLKSAFFVNLEECYDYIIMVLNLQQKYENYDSLKEQQKIYLREIIHQVLCRKAGIYQYLELDAAIKLGESQAKIVIY